MKKIYIVFGLIILLSPSLAYADEIVLTDNGAASVNTAESNNSQTTVVQQSNTASVTNVVTSTSNTGDNQANNTTGGSTVISTGNATTVTDVSTSGNNSVSDVGCCSGTQDNSVVINGNGSTSVNSGSANQNTTVSQTANNTMSLTNSVKGVANTGGNIANNSNGNVYIETGKVTIITKQENGPINTAINKAGISTQSNASLKISGNGAGSVNSVHASNVFTVTQVENNVANVINDIYSHGNSGGNTASFTVGDVVIKTGDVSILNYIKNGPINTSISEVICCDPDKETPPTDNPPTTPPSNPGGGTVTTNNPGGGSSGSSNGSSGSSNNPGNGRVLPATGNIGYLLALLANTLLLLFGGWLRLRAGNSPGFLM